MKHAPVVVLIAGALACPLVPTSGPAGTPKPGAAGNPANVPYIGKSDPKGNPAPWTTRPGRFPTCPETRVPPYTLPDPLVCYDGTKVTSAEDWRTKRRPEILKAFETEIYGRVP